ncbi:MAG: hypothetical protein IT539_11545 [Bradyrhizobiaceae bacterium]|nr:hypothetical protein [Bradyrhizobiaceae bacterium]
MGLDQGQAVPAASVRSHDRLLQCPNAAEVALPKRDRCRLSWVVPRAILPAIAVIGLGAFLTTSSLQDGKPAELAVIYIGADDCGPCVAWRQAHRQQFLESPEFARLDYREVISPRLHDLRKDEHWPENLRRFRSEFDRVPGAPTWLVLRDDRILVTARGLREWEEIALPRLKSLTR